MKVVIGSIVYLICIFVGLVLMTFYTSGCGRKASFTYVPPCTVTQQGVETVVKCLGSPPATITNGTNGQDGANGAPGLDGQDAVVEVIDPCGDGPGVDEVILRLADGSLLAWYKNKGLFVLEPGNYQTTDSQKCNFVVDANGEVSW